MRKQVIFNTEKKEVRNEGEKRQKWRQKMKRNMEDASFDYWPCFHFCHLLSLLPTKIGSCSQVALVGLQAYTLLDIDLEITGPPEVHSLILLPMAPGIRRQLVTKHVTWSPLLRIWGSMYLAMENTFTPRNWLLLMEVNWTPPYWMFKRFLNVCMRELDIQAAMIVRDSDNHQVGEIHHHPAIVKTRFVSLWSLRLARLIKRFCMSITPKLDKSTTVC